MKRFLLIFVSLLMFYACGSEQHAGSASVTTNGTVAGSVVDSLGAAMGNVSAYLIPVTSDPALAAQKWLNQSTDTSGGYLFEDVPMGEYRLVVRSSDTALAATVDLIWVDSAETVVVPAVPLAGVGSIRINAKDVAFRAGDRFYIPGTDMDLVVSAGDVVAGFVVLGGVPLGSYSQIMMTPVGLASSVPLIAEPLVVIRGEVVLQPGYESLVSVPMGFVTVARGGLTSWGGAGGDTVDVNDSAALRLAVSSKTASVIRIKTMIAGNGDMLRIASNKTLLGVGDSAGLDSLGFSVRTDSNIVIQNLNFRRGAIDAISIEESAHHIWIDHNTFDAYGDGLVDVKRASDYITISWNHFRKHRSANLIGHSDGNGAQDSLHLLVTFHHNWFEKVENTCPRVRYGTVHVYNNYYDSISDFAIASTQYAKVVVEANLFRKVKYPTLVKHTSAQNGDLVALDNFYELSGPVVTYGTAFDPHAFYSYTADPVLDVRSELVLGAGSGRLLSLIR